MNFFIDWMKKIAVNCHQNKKKKHKIKVFFWNIIKKKEESDFFGVSRRPECLNRSDKGRLTVHWRKQFHLRRRKWSLFQPSEKFQKVNHLLCLFFLLERKLPIFNKKGIFVDFKIEISEKKIWFICRLCSNMTPVPHGAAKERFEFINNYLSTVSETFQEKIDSRKRENQKIQIQVVK